MLGVRVVNKCRNLTLQVCVMLYRCDGYESAHSFSVIIWVVNVNRISLASISTLTMSVPWVQPVCVCVSVQSSSQGVRKATLHSHPVIPVISSGKGSVAWRQWEVFSLYRSVISIYLGILLARRSDCFMYKREGKASQPFNEGDSYQYQCLSSDCWKASISSHRYLKL